jgi:recombination protein RecT
MAQDKTQNQNQSTAIVKSQDDQFKTIRDYIMSRHRAIASIAPKYLDTERMVRLALGASSRSPKLLLCTPKSWVMALMDCAYYGLEPNPALGHAYLIPYENRKLRPPQYEVSFMPGYKGLILLGCEFGGFDDIDGRIVYGSEITSGRFKETPHDPRSPFFHDPIYEADEREEIAGAYAVGWRGPDKRPRFMFLTKTEIEGYRARSRASQDGPWTTDWSAMAKKTAVKRMLALASLRPGNKLGVALDQESNADRGEVAHAQDWLAHPELREDDGPRRSRTEQLADDLTGRAGRAQPEIPVGEPPSCDPGHPAD